MSETMEAVEDRDALIGRFIEKARVAAAIVSEVGSMEEAVSYAINFCGERGGCRIKISGCEEKLSHDAEELCETKQARIIAAPALTGDDYQLLESRCRENGFTCIDSDLRSHLAGVDIGFTYGDIGLAETGTVVVNCPSEELRLATMICEYHICVLPKSKITIDSFAASDQLRRFMLNTPNYTAFITGPSRTADIERVLTIGVHGPLELHVLLLED